MLILKAHRCWDSSSTGTDNVGGESMTFVELILMLMVSVTMLIAENKAL